MKRYTQRLETPLGPLRLVADDAGLCEIAFAADSPAAAPTAHPVLAAASQQLTEYFCGERWVFDLPLAMAGTEFQRAVWHKLLAIPFAQTSSYGELARALGRPRAVRAVGAANGQNPLAIVVPCHRVIGSDGSLTGYAGGLTFKRRLLEHERQVAERHGFAPPPKQLDWLATFGGPA